MSNKIIILVVEGTKLYKCIKCGEMSKRRYNTERHFRRFHENIYPGKTCCGTTFCTKSDFYDHKEKTHNEKRKYTKGQNQSISESDEVEQEDTIIKSDMEISETRNNNELGLLPIKKYFLHKWQKNSFYKMENNRAPLTNMENVSNESRRTAMKRASRKILRNNVRLSNSFSSKENVKIYNITARSTKDIDKGLKSIIF